MKNNNNNNNNLELTLLKSDVHQTSKVLNTKRVEQKKFCLKYRVKNFAIPDTYTSGRLINNPKYICLKKIKKQYINSCNCL